MLFALFFGAGNLIFPAQLGQNAGDQLLPAIAGFLVTGIGLPLLGILAIGYSKRRNLQEIANRVHPAYGIFFTALLYMTIGPFFAAPRTGAVAYELALSPFVGEKYASLGLFLFTLLFFGLTFVFALSPAKMVDLIGKMMSPAIIILLLFLFIMVLVKPMGGIQPAQKAYTTLPFLKGFTEGYNTMDALSSLVFGIIVIQSIRSLGIQSNKEILKVTTGAGLVASVLLGVVYFGIAYIGATSTEVFGFFDTGGPVLTNTASYYLGSVGSIMLGIIITLACLTTNIGLITACGEYFHSLLPTISYKWLVIFFTAISFTFANFGLSSIIKYSVPVLMFLYPLAIILILLTFLSPFFHHARIVYISVTTATFLISSVDGLKSLCESLQMDYFTWLSPIIKFYNEILPLYKEGLGWLLPALIIFLLAMFIEWVLEKMQIKRKGL